MYPSKNTQRSADRCLLSMLAFCYLLLYMYQIFSTAFIDLNLF